MLDRSHTMLGQSRIALVRCVALEKHKDHSVNFEEVMSVSVKLHASSALDALLETVTVQTQRHGALWQDACLWESQGGFWRRCCSDDTHFHLLEVFRMAQQFCSTGVSLDG